MLTSARSRFYGLNLGIPLLCAAVVFLLFDMTRIDIAISDFFYDPVHQVFPLEHVHLFEKITHKWARVIPNWTARWPLSARCCRFSGLYSSRKNALGYFACWISSG